jgi:ribosomal protein S18 acetylase RimI-like enzyme
MSTQADTRFIEEHRSASQIEAQQYRGSLEQVVHTGYELLFVAGYGHTVMGSASVTISDLHANLQHIFVVPEAREVGLADSLMTYVLTELKTRGISCIAGRALPGDRATKNLFERHGLIAQTIIVGKSL